MRARSEEIAALGHDERFLRNWQYYLGICARHSTLNKRTWCRSNWSTLNPTPTHKPPRITARQPAVPIRPLECA